MGKTRIHVKLEDLALPLTAQITIPVYVLYSCHVKIIVTDDSNECSGSKAVKDNYSTDLKGGFSV